MQVRNIVSDFRSKASFPSDNEVALFRKLAISIVKNSRSAFIDETHGATKANVTFALSTGASSRCEVADLLIIVRGHVRKPLRATFWQAKKQAASGWAASGSSDEHIDFKGQFNQWDLLSRRPLVTGVAPFSPPPDLLSGFTSASIGSFGVFYERNSAIEVSHSVAEFISCSNPNSAHSTMVSNGHLQKYLYNGGEAIVRATLTSFLDSLFAHQLGAELLPGDTTHRWIVDYAKAKAMASGSSVTTGFFDFYDSINQRGDFAPQGDGISVLIVDAASAA